MDLGNLVVGGVTVSALVVLIMWLVKRAKPDINRDLLLFASIAVAMALSVSTFILTQGPPTTAQGWADLFVASFVFALSIGKGYDEVKVFRKSRSGEPTT